MNNFLLYKDLNGIQLKPLESDDYNIEGIKGSYLYCKFRNEFGIYEILPMEYKGFYINHYWEVLKITKENIKSYDLNLLWDSYFNEKFNYEYKDEFYSYDINKIKGLFKRFYLGFDNEEFVMVDIKYANYIFESTVNLNVIKGYDSKLKKWVFITKDKNNHYPVNFDCEVLETSNEKILVKHNDYFSLYSIIDKNGSSFSNADMYEVIRLSKSFDIYEKAKTGEIYAKFGIFVFNKNSNLSCIISKGNVIFQGENGIIINNIEYPFLSIDFDLNGIVTDNPNIIPKETIYLIQKLGFKIFHNQ